MRRVLLGCGVAVLSLLSIGVVHRVAHAGVPVTSKLMDRHMEITLRRLPEPGDSERADAIVADAKQLVAKYANVADAERDGYTKFLPNIELPEEHYTNATFAAEAWGDTFDPQHPTSLVYKRDAAGLHIAGVMYTASNMVTEAGLDRRVPTSIGTWHRHVNFCWAPAGSPLRDAYLGEHPKFGFNGSIWTRDACDAANGSFSPIRFDWMIHVWPNETTQAAIWSIHGDGSPHDMVGEHEHQGSMGAMGSGDPPLTAAGKLPIPLDHLPSAGVATGDVIHGATVFAQNCASCHGASGRAGPDAPQLAAQGLAAGQIAFMVRNPGAIDVTSDMPRLPISDGDLADVAAYVSQLK